MKAFSLAFSVCIGLMELFQAKPWVVFAYTVAAIFGNCLNMHYQNLPNAHGGSLGYNEVTLNIEDTWIRYLGGEYPETTVKLSMVGGSAITEYG